MAYQEFKNILMDNEHFNISDLLLFLFETSCSSRLRDEKEKYFKTYLLLFPVGTGPFPVLGGEEGGGGMPASLTLS